MLIVGQPRTASASLAGEVGDGAGPDGPQAR